MATTAHKAKSRSKPGDLPTIARVAIVTGADATANVAVVAAKPIWGFNRPTSGLCDRKENSAASCDVLFIMLRGSLPVTAQARQLAEAT